MAVNRYTKTESGGFIVEPQSSQTTNAVEIRDQETGRIYQSITDITDLRNAKSAADPGDRIFVYPGEYNTRNLLKDQVDWHFMEGAKVDNEGLSNGAIFENIGAHGSPGGTVRSKVTGKGSFTFDGDGSGAALLNPGADANSEISLDIKRFEITEGSDAIMVLHSAGKIDVDVDTFVTKTPDPSTAIGNGAISYGEAPFGAPTDDAEANIRIGRLDATQDDGARFIFANGEAEEYNGTVNVRADVLDTGTGHSGYIGGSQNTGDAGVTLSIGEHRGETAYGWYAYAGNPTVIFDDFDLNVGGETDSSAISFYADNVGELYLRDVTLDHAGATSTGTNTINGVGTVHNLGNTEVNGFVDSDITVIGDQINSL